jgi:hypothetical protein
MPVGGRKYGGIQPIGGQKKGHWRQILGNLGLFYQLRCIQGGCARLAKDDVMPGAATKTDQKFIAGEKIETTPTTPLLRYKAGFIIYNSSNFPPSASHL